jgi:hypothetical protein
LDQDYRGIEVLGETPQTDKALIAAVTALEAGLVEDERLEKAILVYKLGAQTRRRRCLLANLRKALGSLLLTG